jgi:prepilin-type processing-associated H-X9-DG protein
MNRMKTKHFLVRYACPQVKENTALGLTAAPRMLRSGRNRTAFTLVELLVVVSLAVFLFATLVPVMARSRSNILAVQCMNNNRQLCAAWRMYADESRDNIVFASDDGLGTRNPFNQYAWTASHLDFVANNTANWDTNADIVTHPLWPYTAGDASIYRCPADQSFVIVNGVAKPRVRSYSINAYLGGSTGGSIGLSPGYRLFLKTTDLSAPGPAKTTVFIEERWEAINWGNFLTDMAGYSPSNPSLYTFQQDLPGDIHGFAGSVSFADGHVELHRWRDARTVPRLPQQGVVTNLSVPRDQDVAWLQDHATRP